MKKRRQPSQAKATPYHHPKTYFSRSGLTDTFLPEDRSPPVRGEQALWSAVITQALMDAASRSPKMEAQYEKEQARRWLTENQDDFVRVCDYAGLCPSYVRRMAKRALARDCAWRAEPKRRPKRTRRKLLKLASSEEQTRHAA